MENKAKLVDHSDHLGSNWKQNQILRMRKYQGDGLFTETAFLPAVRQQQLQALFP
jgi:hypothetical protein